MNRLLPVLIVLLLALAGCSKDHPNQPVGNAAPRTFLWLYPDPPDSTTTGTGISRQHLHWWGEDPDGTVNGYLFGFVRYRSDGMLSPDTLAYVWTTRTDTILRFPLDTLFRYFTVFVRAVDDQFEGLPEGSAVRIAPSPAAKTPGSADFDKPLPTLINAMDAKGAFLVFPIRNTPPSIQFASNPYNAAIPFRQADTTFTAATFAFNGHDPDGDNTLLAYRIALNDTSDPSRWLTLGLRDTIVTLVVPRTRSDGVEGEVDADVYAGLFFGRRFVGRIAGLRMDASNVLFVQSEDVARDFSPAIRMPAVAGVWYVKKPRGRLLMVSDDVQYGLAADTTYRRALASIPTGEFTTVDKFNIALGLTSSNKESFWLGQLMPSFLDPALIYTFLLYDYVFWYTEQLPTLVAAQVSLFPYLQNGGKVMFSTTFQAASDPRNALRDFAPIDSIGNVGADTRVYGSYMVFADSTVSDNTYPNLQFTGSLTTIHSVFMRPIYKRTDSRYIYHLQASHLNRYPGTPNVGVVDGQGTIAFMALPLHLLDNTQSGAGLSALFTKLFTQHFSPAQRVDRRKF
jgi:hypothetical protein